MNAKATEQVLLSAGCGSLVLAEVKADLLVGAFCVLLEASHPWGCLQFP